MPRVTFHFDVVSPWSVFAYAVLKRYRQPWNLDLVLKPMFLGGVMSASGNQPPINVKNKGAWMNGSDLPLASAFYEVPYTFPAQFPLNTIHCMRVLRAVEKIAPAKLEKATDLFYAAVWQPSSGSTALDAINPASFPTLLAKDGLFSKSEIEQLIAAANSDEIKNLLKTESKELVEAGGAFGFPWIVVERDDGEKRSFFGSDRFEVMAFWLGKEWEGPLPQGRKGGQAKL